MNVEELLKQSGLKLTSPRILILSALMDTECALSGQQLFDQLNRKGSKKMDKVTVYRTLSSFLEAGIIHQIPSDDRSGLYSFHNHKTQTKAQVYVHFICQTCENTFCLDVKNLDIKLTLNPDDQKGYQIVSQELMLRGYCPHCTIHET